MSEGLDDLGSTQVEVRVGGRPVAPAPPCAHGSFNVNPVVANLVDDDGRVVAHRLQVKARCAECGVPARFDLASALPSADGLTAGIPFSPLEE